MHEMIYFLHNTAAIDSYIKIRTEPNDWAGNKWKFLSTVGYSH